VTDIDVGEYCRRVEDHLTKVNAGHLVRIVGTGFDLVRGWAETGVPLSVVYRGIEMKAERHKEGQAKRPLRIEFCEPDVRAVFENWRRAVGFSDGAPGLPPSREASADRRSLGEGGQTRGVTDAAPKRPSLTRHLDRAIDRLSRAGGRLDWPAGLRDECDRVLQELVALRAAAAHARGAQRDEAAAHLPALDADLASALRLHAPAPLRASLQDEAAAELAAYRARLNPAEWQRSVDVTTDRLLRDRLGLPVIDL